MISQTPAVYLTPLLCSCCGGRDDQEPIYVCFSCMNTQKVATFCVQCGRRHAYTLEEAVRMFNQTGTGINPTRTGIVYRFENGCPDCRPQARRLGICAFTADLDGESEHDSSASTAFEV